MLTQEENIKFWAARVKEPDILVTSNDVVLRHLELEVVNKFLQLYSSPESLIIDLGCGNGWIEDHLDNRIQFCTLYGIDPTKELIELTHKKNNITYLIGDVFDITKLPIPDIVFTVRALINVPNIIDVYETLLKHCKSSTQFLFIEATKQGLASINRARSFFSLPLIQEKEFNNYLDEEVLKKYFNVVHTEHFSSSYYFGSRIINALVSNEPKYNDPVNKFFADLPNFGEWGLHRAFHCKSY